MRTIDKSALFKTFGVLLMSTMFVLTYAADLMLCTDLDILSDYTTLHDNTCKMSLYTVMFIDDTHENVYVMYYLTCWCFVWLLAIFGFVILLCNCNMLCRRLFAIMLVCMAGMLSTAEVLSIMDTNQLAEAQFTDGDTSYYSTAFGGLNACVWILECYILANTAFDAWSEE
jgi:hypothetical protein